MRADHVVVASPRFDQDLNLVEGVAVLPMQELVAYLRVEALDVSVLSGRTGLDDGGSGPDCGNLSPDRRGDELRAGVGPDEGRDAAQHAQVRQDIDDVSRGTRPPNPDRQALTGELV